MRVSSIYRVNAVVAVALIASGSILVTAGVAGSATKQSSHPVLRFNDADRKADLTIPTPPCPKSNENCEWKLFVNEPLMSGKTLVGAVTGTSGALTVAYPEFCGVIQADALVGPAPWQFEVGIRRRINTCVSTTTTVPTSTSTSTSTITKDD